MMSILNQMITIRNDPRYDERDKGKPIIGNVVSLRIPTLSYGETCMYTLPCEMEGSQAPLQLYTV